MGVYIIAEAGVNHNGNISIEHQNMVGMFKKMKNIVLLLCNITI